MKGYGQFCPVAKACEVLAERWTPLVLRELLCGSRRFNELQRGVPLMSRSLLAQRLRTLEDAGIVEQRTVRGDRRGNEYHLTAAGEELRPIIESIGTWGQRWVQAEIEEQDLDASLLMWDVRRQIRPQELPPQRVVMRMDFTGVSRGRRRWWLLIDPDGVDLCIVNPGFEVDLEMVVPVLELTRYWLGKLSWSQLLQCAGVEIKGAGWLRRSLPKWLGRADLAHVRHVGS